MTENELTVETLSAEIERRLDGAYDLVYVDYRDELTSEQVSWIASGDTDSLFSDDDLMVWESDQRWTSACDIVDETAREIFREYDDTDEIETEFQGSDERLSLIELVQDRRVAANVYQLAAGCQGAANGLHVRRGCRRDVLGERVRMMTDTRDTAQYRVPYGEPGHVCQRCGVTDCTHHDDRRCCVCGGFEWVGNHARCE